MNGWIIYKQDDAEKNKSYIDWFIKEAALQNIQLKLIVRESLAISATSHHILLDGEKSPLPDFVVIRTMEASLTIAFEQLNIPTFNNSSVSRLANDKANAYQYVKELGIDTVQTYFYPKDLIPYEIPLPYPFVLKTREGKGGSEVFFVRNKDDYDKYIDLAAKKAYLIQEANVSLGKDLRVFIVNNKVLAAVLRENEKDFRANYTLGGHASLYELSSEEKSIIDQIIGHYQFDFVGIDFFIDYKGNLLFNEIEDVVGSRTLSLLTNLNIVRHYVQHIKETINSKKQ